MASCVLATCPTLTVSWNLTPSQVFPIFLLPRPLRALVICPRPHNLP